MDREPIASICGNVGSRRSARRRRRFSRASEKYWRNRPFALSYLPLRYEYDRPSRAPGPTSRIASTVRADPSSSRPSRPRPHQHRVDPADEQHREPDSTRDQGPIADADSTVPRMRGPSQSPGTARSSTSLGRREMLTMFWIRPRRSSFGRCGLRKPLPVRRCLTNSRLSPPRP